MSSSTLNETSKISVLMPNLAGRGGHSQHCYCLCNALSPVVELAYLLPRRYKSADFPHPFKVEANIEQVYDNRLFIYGIASTSIYFCHFLRLGKPYLLFKAWYETSKELKYLIQSRKVLKQDTIKDINQLKKHVSNLPIYFDEVEFNRQAN